VCVLYVPNSINSIKIYAPIIENAKIINAPPAFIKNVSSFVISYSY
jgi:hypothetical protein